MCVYINTCVHYFCHSPKKRLPLRIAGASEKLVPAAGQRGSKTHRPGAGAKRNLPSDPTWGDPMQWQHMVSE